MEKFLALLHVPSLLLGASPFLIALAFKLFGGRGVDAVVQYSIHELLLGLKAEGVDDADFKEFLHAVVLAFIRLAEKKLPAGGLGPQRKQLVLDYVVKYIPFLKGQEASLGQVIDALVAKENEALAKLDAESSSSGQDSGSGPDIPGKAS